MPTRRLPQTAKERVNALRTGKERKDSIPAPTIIPYSAGTISRLDTLYPVFKAKIDAIDAALIVQGTATALVKNTRKKAELFIIHFYEALQNAIARETFTPEIRPGYGLDINDSNLPTIKTEADVIFWGEKAATGEAARIAGGGSPVTFPAIAEVNTAVTNFKNANLQQANAKQAYEAAQIALEQETEEADKLILKMWNETETAFDDGNKPQMRRNAREWGVVYIPTAGEAPSPEDYSIQGTVTNASTGNPIAEVVVLLAGTDVVELTNEQGKYLIPVQDNGSYNLTFYKNDYELHTVNNVSVVAGTITTANAALAPAPPTGTITGRITRAGAGVSGTVNIDGYPISVTTDGAGNYTINNAPSGNQNIRAYVNDNPANQQTQTIAVPQGGTANLDFNF